ncbi:MAG: HlyD family efflux transporter periplasmic adaptor subunit [Saprospiraceae bacterium]|nr:HlyD family efflux transporter periplasmic adaptor subunit [Saprospiraceae bacterium]
MKLFNNDYEIKKDVLPLSIIKTSLFVILINGIILLSFVFFVRFKNVIKVQSEMKGQESSLAVICTKPGVVVFDKLVNSQSIEKNQVIGHYEQNTDIDPILKTNTYLTDLTFEDLLIDPKKTVEELNALDVHVEEILPYISTLKDEMRRYSALYFGKRILFEEKEKIYQDETGVEVLEMKLYALQDSLNNELNTLLLGLNKRDSVLYNENSISKENIERKNIESLREKVMTINNNLAQLAFLHQSSDNKVEFLTARNNYYSELGDIKTRIKNILHDLKSRIQIWENDNTILAPYSGIVIFDDTKLRRAVDMNDTLAIISPKNINQSTYFVSMDIPKKYINYLKEGQKVKTEIDEYPSIENGYLEGVINFIPRETSGDVYKCKVQLTHGLQTNYGKNIEPKGVKYTGISKISVENQSLFEKLKKILIWKYWDFQK